MTDHAITIVMPAYNEEAGIQMSLQYLIDTLDASPMRDVEIIVVDDGSQDDTVALATAFERVRLVQHQHNQGYGAALKTGIRHATHDLICIIDADGTYPADRITDLQRMMIDDGADMVVGARTGANVNIPLLRRPPKAFLRWLASYVAQMPIPDLNSGLRIFRRSVALRFFSLLPNQFSFTTTITLAMLVNDYRVQYVPIDYAMRRGRSKIRPIRDTLSFIYLVLRIALYFAPLRIFLPLSMSMFLIGIAWGVFSMVVLGQFADASTIVLLTTAVQLLAIGMLAELITKRLQNEYRPL